MVHYVYIGASGYNFKTKNNMVYFLSEDFFTLTNSVYPDKVPHYAAFRSSPFAKVPLFGIYIYKGLMHLISDKHLWNKMVHLTHPNYNVS